MKPVAPALAAFHRAKAIPLFGYRAGIGLAAGIVLLGGLGQVPAYAATDGQAPVVVSGTVTPDTVDVTSAAGSVTVSVQLTDQTGVQAATVSLRSATDHYDDGLFDQPQYQDQSLTLTSGTAQSGTWSATFLLPRHAAMDTIEADLTSLTDTLDNQADLIGNPESLGTFSLTYTPDQDAPSVESRSVTPAMVDVTSSAAAVTGTLHLSDATGAKAPIAHLFNPAGNQMGQATMKLTDGTTQDGTWSVSFAIPKGAAKGTWKITTTDINDTDNNTSYTDDPLTLGTTTVTAITAGNASVSGSTTVGSSLSVNAGSWSPAPMALAYQWFRTNAAGVSTAITGATARTYTLQPADLGSRVSVTLTGSRPGFTPVVRTIVSGAKIAPGNLVSPTPTISGATRVGATVTANPGTWAPSPVALTYQWMRVSSSGQYTAIKAATSKTYIVQAADRGYRLSVRVTGSKTGYVTTSRAAGATAAVTAGSLTAPAPSIGGTVRVHSMLTANPGAWRPSPVALSYQWFRVSSAGKAVAIPHASGQKYSVQSADHGYRISVRITGTETGYNTATRTVTTTARA